MAYYDREWTVIVAPTCISAMTRAGGKERFGRPSVASFSRIGNIWWVDRVKVHNGDESKGIGKILVAMLKNALIESWEEDMPTVVQVCPGGYGTPIKVLRSFYLSCGFRIVKDEPELTMEWSWREKESST